MIFETDFISLLMEWRGWIVSFDDVELGLAWSEDSEETSIV